MDTHQRTDLAFFWISGVCRVCISSHASIYRLNPTPPQAAPHLLHPSAPFPARPVRSSVHSGKFKPTVHSSADTAGPVHSSILDPPSSESSSSGRPPTCFRPARTSSTKASRSCASRDPSYSTPARLFPCGGGASQFATARVAVRTAGCIGRSGWQGGWR